MFNAPLLDNVASGVLNVSNDRFEINEIFLNEEKTQKLLVIFQNKYIPSYTPAYEKVVTWHTN